jgi:Ser/Thr protein kinase RdoA (MazF antagonist)
VLERFGSFEEMVQKTTRFDEIANDVLGNYELLEPRRSFIGHNHNITYKVTTANSESFLLRIHIPITSAMGTHGADFSMVNSEVTWMLALGQETDLVIQKPIRNKSGALVTSISLEDGATINCTLLSWIDGEPYHRELENEKTAYQIGTLLAVLHNHASHWEIPEGFTRPKRDIQYFEKMLSALKPAVDDGRISDADFSELSQSIALLIGMIGSLDDTRQSYGIMHADTHKGNMLYHEGEIRLIDFSFCAFGNYMFDLGICLSDMKVELHKYCLQGYHSLRKLPDHYQRLIEGFFLGSIVGAFSFWVANPHAQEILARKVPQITRDYAVKFNQNEHFWF